MAYIGTKPTIGNFQICDAISVVNGQAAYTMQVSSVNVIPESANHMLVSLNGILQKPGSSYTVSGSTITFASNLATGDVIDFIQILGNVLDLGVPSDATVTTAKLGSNAVTSAKMFSGFANGITMADQWRLTANITSTNGFITANLEQVDTNGQGTLGTAMSESSGVFSFPSTGIYLVELFAMTNANGADNIIMEIQATIDNSTYVPVAEGVNGVDGALQTLSCSSLIDVTNISNVKIKFNVQSLNTNSYIDGNTSQTNTGFTFIRLGDT